MTRTAFAKPKTRAASIGGEAKPWPKSGDFRHDLHPDLRSDHVPANLPFNVSDYICNDDDRALRVLHFNVPPTGCTNSPWVQPVMHHLNADGLAGFVLANGSLSSNQTGEGNIRRALIEADLVNCMAALPGQLSDSTQITVEAPNGRNSRFEQHGLN